MKQILIHCKPSLLEDIKEMGMFWSYSPQFGEEEIDVTVYDNLDLDDEELCEFFNLDYDQVNCIELA